MTIKPRDPRPLAEIIREYEGKDSADIEAELLRAGIDPRPTIDAVSKLVQERLEEWRQRGVLHSKETIEAAA